MYKKLRINSKHVIHNRSESVDPQKHGGRGRGQNQGQGGATRPEDRILGRDYRALRQVREVRDLKSVMAGSFLENQYSDPKMP